MCGTRAIPCSLYGDANMLSGNKLARALAANDGIRAIIAKGESGVDRFSPVLMRLYSLITTSAVYTDYRKKKRRELDDDVKFWSVVLNTIVLNNPVMLEAARTDENFSLAGYQKGLQMAIESLREYNDSERSYTDAKKSLAESLEKAYELYHALLMLPVFITDLEAERIETAKEKYCPTDEELNPNMRFVDNALVNAIRNNPDMAEYLKKRP